MIIKLYNSSTYLYTQTYYREMTGLVIYLITFTFTYIPWINTISNQIPDQESTIHTVINGN